MRSKLFWVGIAFGLLVTLVFWSSLVLHISEPLGAGHEDAYHKYFTLKHYVTIASTGDWAHVTTYPMFYGFKNSLFFNDHFLVLGLLGIFLQPVTHSVVTSFHVLALVTVFLSFTSMYGLMWHWTRRVFPSLFAGFAFAFNPFMTARFPDHMEIIAVEWIPLLFLSFELWMTRQKGKYGLIFFLLLTTQLMASALYTSVTLSVIFPIYAIIRFRQLHMPLKKLWNRWVYIGMIVFISILSINIYFYLFPYRMSMAPRSPDEIVLYSPYVTDYLFTAPNNLLFGGIKAAFAKMYPTFVRTGIPSEHNLFIGFIPLVFFIVSFWVVRVGRYASLWKACIAIAMISWLLSLGPWVHVTDTLGFPGLYGLLYRVDPLFTFLRVPARFSLFVFFPVAAIIGFSVFEIQKKKWGPWVCIAGMLLLCVEYWVKPLEFLTVSPNTAAMYSLVNNDSRIGVILELPIANNLPIVMPQSREEERDADYLLWATLYHDKTLLNGYAGIFPVLYWQRAQLLSTDFPSEITLKLVKLWGVDAIILHENEFPDSSYYLNMKNKLAMMGVKELYSQNGLTLFDLRPY